MFKGVKMKNFSSAENFGTLTTDCSLQGAAQYRGPLNTGGRSIQGAAHYRWPLNTGGRSLQVAAQHRGPPEDRPCSSSEVNYLAPQPATFANISRPGA